MPVVRQANKRGIPVFTLDRGAACGKCQVNFLETDNVALGKEGADYIADRLKKRYGSLKGNVVDLEGLLGTTAGDDREKGFAQEFAKLSQGNPDFKLVARQAADFDADKGFNITTQLLAATATSMRSSTATTTTRSVPYVRSGRRTASCPSTIRSTSSSSASTAPSRG